MTAPRTWTLLEKVEDRLKAITIANGFNTEAGTKTTREPLQIPDDAGIALAVAMETLSNPDNPALRNVGHLVRFVVIGKISTALTDAQQRLHELIDDITRCMADKAAWMSSVPVGTQFPTFVEVSVIPPAEGMKWIGAVVRYSAHITNR